MRTESVDMAHIPGKKMAVLGRLTGGCWTVLTRRRPPHAVHCREKRGIVRDIDRGVARFDMVIICYENLWSMVGVRGRRLYDARGWTGAGEWLSLRSFGQVWWSPSAVLSVLVVGPLHMPRLAVVLYNNEHA